MGTRADFWIGRGKEADWLGSIAYDGYPDGNPGPILTADNEPSYRERVRHVIAATDSGTWPEQGWPWPWDDSSTTDYAYAFDDGKVWASCFGGPWFDPLLPDEQDRTVGERAVFPDMAARKNNPPIGDVRSGIIVISKTSL